MLSFEELCDFVESELEQNPRKIFGKIFRKEPYKTSLEAVFPMIINDSYFNQTCTILLKSKQKTPPVCKMHGCNNYVKYMSGKFKQYCSRSCAGTATTNNPKVQEKRKITCIEKYGHESPMQNEKVKEKIKQANLERYGVEYSFQSSEIQAKIKKANLEKYGHESHLRNISIRNEIKKTNLERYGSISPFGNPEIQSKIKQTNLERYGHESSLSNSCIRDKIKQTNLEKYGHENPLSNSDIQKKIKKANLERYGHEKPSKSPDIQEKTKQTNLERYGASNPMQNIDVKEKTHQTNLEKYGSISPFGNSVIQEKIRQTNLERYGHENPLSNSDIQKKIKKTNLERYGSISPFGNSEIQEKIKQTNLEKYGTEYSVQNHDIQEKIRQTNIERYGSITPLGSKDIREKIRQTNIERYGTYFQQAHIQNINILQNPVLLGQAINEHRIIDIAKMCNCNTSTVYDYITKYDIILPIYPNSYWETELAEYLDSINITYELNTRKIIAPYELDFYLPDYNLAIELNGAYWHSDHIRDEHYHYDKWKLCYDQGIQLIQIWDTDWESTKDIWKSRLQYLTGKSSNKIYARKCSIETISSKQARSFYDQTHLQGFTGASVHLGLIYNGIPLAMMSFGHSRGTKSNEIELVRFCSKMGYQVTGAASKLLKAYQKQNPDMTIISFSDNMYSDGSLYESLGFTKEYDLSPDYSYAKNKQRYHKQNFTKASIQKKFNISDDDISAKTEYALMNELGYVRIWDAGKIKWILKP